MISLFAAHTPWRIYYIYLITSSMIAQQYSADVHMYNLNVVSCPLIGSKASLPLYLFVVEKDL